MQCIALLKNKKEPTRCKYRAKANCQFCGVHLKSHHAAVPLAPLKEQRGRQRRRPMQPTALNPPVKKIRLAKHMRQHAHRMSIVIQACARGFLQRLHLSQRGPAVLHRQILTNSYDFMTFEDCHSIPVQAFFSYLDRDTFVYGFNINSIMELLSYSHDNPYTREPFPANVLEILESLRPRCATKVASVPDGYVSDQLRAKRYCVQVFQALDDLELYTEVNWFLRLSVHQLQWLYYDLMDIWDRRASLTTEAKTMYVNERENGKLFKYSGTAITRLRHKIDLQKSILDVVHRLCTEGSTKANCITASYWFITSLTAVSQDAALGYPHLAHGD